MIRPFDKIEIEFIEHGRQRYPTCGDWRIVHGMADEKVMLISVSRVGDWRSECLVALHELAELIMCQANGITPEVVDKFDMDYEAARKPGDESEPGDMKAAPYFTQHGLATAIERMAATQMGITWPEHEKKIGSIFE